MMAIVSVLYGGEPIMTSMMNCLLTGLFFVSLLAVLPNCQTTMQGSAISHPQPVADPDINVEIFKPEKVWMGTTLMADNHRRGQPRIIEVDMEGRIVWEYAIPSSLSKYNNPGFDVEWLPDDHVLFLLPRYGVFEVDRAGKTMWSYLDSKVSHDADRLPNGNTLVVWGGGDGVNDAQVKEISPDGKIVWSWRAKDHFFREPFKGISDNGWTHTNSATRLPNGNTIISLRNFGFVAEVDPDGAVIRTMGEGIVRYQHDPEMQPDGRLLTATHSRDRAVEIDLNTGEVVWRFNPRKGQWRVRDADRLPNGNTLITDATKLVEVTPNGKVVWLLRMKGVTYQMKDWPAQGFYKAERIARH